MTAGPAAELDPAAGTLQTTRRLLWLLVVPVLALLGVLTAVQFHQRMQDAERELLRRADERAQELESIARPAMAHVRDLRAMLAARWHDPPDFGPALRRTLAPSGGGWTLDAAGPAQRERLGQVWWAEPDGRPPEALWLRRAQAFVEQARIVHQRAPGFEATWFAAADVNSSFGYPWLDTAQMMRSMGARQLLDVNEPRRRGVQRAREQFARDPNELVFWGMPYVSQLNGELVMSHGAKLIVDGDYRGEVSLDFRLDELQRRVDQWQAAPGATGRVWIVDARQNVLADSAQPLRAPAGAGLADTLVRLPLAERLPEVMADADQIGQVLLNLLVKAQQALATHEGPRRLCLSTGVEQRRPAREPRVWLRVQDSGPGVPAALRESIFAPFFTTKPEGLGTGMGLAVSRGLVREHGGELLLEEAGAGGASFRLSLPISGRAEAASQTIGLDPLAPLGLLRLLVVDDEAEIAELMRDMLEGAGYEVAVAESGAVALELLAEARFDAIVSDLRMPEMDGAALWRALQLQHAALARLCCSSPAIPCRPGRASFSTRRACRGWRSRSPRASCWPPCSACWTTEALAAGSRVRPPSSRPHRSWCG